MLLGAKTAVPEESFESGAAEISLALPTEPGAYKAYVEADDGLDVVRSPGIDLVVAAPAPVAPASPSSPSARPIAIAVLLAVGVGTGAAVARWRARAIRT